MAGVTCARGARALLLPRCYHFTPHEGEPGISAPMTHRWFLARLGRRRAAQCANRPGSYSVDRGFNSRPLDALLAGRFGPFLGHFCGGSLALRWRTKSRRAVETA